MNHVADISGKTFTCACIDFQRIGDLSKMIQVVYLFTYVFIDF